MAKKVLFALFFSSFFFTATTSFALNKLVEPENINLKTDQCDAPAPDSFRVTSEGLHFVALAWHPAWVGATHTLTEFVKNQSTGAWEPVDTFPNVTGSAITVTNLSYGPQRRFVIATNCNNGDPSNLTAWVDPIGLILDLVMSGRTPINPSTVLDCKIPIHYPDFNWVGFSVTQGQGLNSVSNYFEFGIGSEGQPLIKRPTNGPPLVAAEKTTGNFPNGSVPVVELDEYSFDIRRIFNGAPSYLIGRLDLSFDGFSKKVQICQNGLIPWDNVYIFNPLTAQSGTGFQSPIVNDRNEYSSQVHEKIEVESPFGAMLNVFVPQAQYHNKSLTLSLLNMNGQALLRQNFDFEAEIISLQVSDIPSGIYLLRIESEGYLQNKIVIKPE